VLTLGLDTFIFLTANINCLSNRKLIILNCIYVQLPPLFYFPKSQLQCYGESVYSTTSNSNLLSKCNNEQSPLERLTSVVAWSISTTRPTSFGVAPYNPILGETHHVSKGDLNVLLEKVSINPPVSALHATDDKENIEMIWCQKPAPKFRGISNITTLPHYIYHYIVNFIYTDTIKIFTLSTDHNRRSLKTSDFNHNYL
jgi:hypothetical protein